MATFEQVFFNNNNKHIHFNLGMLQNYHLSALFGQHTKYNQLLPTVLADCVVDVLIHDCTIKRCQVISKQVLLLIFKSLLPETYFPYSKTFEESSSEESSHSD